MTKQEIYEQMLGLIFELHATNVAEKIFSAAKEGDSKKVEEVFETFKMENSDLYERIVSFGEEYNKVIEESITGLDGEIFGIEDKENSVFEYDSDIIDSLSFVSFTIFAKIDETYLFDWCSEVSDSYVESVEEAGYDAMANFIANYTWIDWVGDEDEEQYPTWYDLLVAIFEGEFEEDGDGDYE